MPVINGVYLKDFTALPGAVADANIIPIAITGDNIAYRTTVAGIVTDARITAKLLTGLSVTGGAVVAADTILAAFGKVQNQINGKQGTITLTTTGTSGAATLVSNTLNIPNYADGGVLSLSAIGAVPNANAATITGTVLNLQPADASFGGVVTTGTQTFAGTKTLNNDIYVIGGAQVYGLSAIGEYDGGAQIPPGYGGNYALTLGSGLTSNGLSLYATGKGYFLGQLRLDSTITNGTYTYTLPSATGTLALTSALSGYLPLTGGTLTGALSGTSATFSGDLTIDTNTLYVDSTNNRIGIGTTSPTNPLHILSNTVSQLNVAALSGNTNAQINLEPIGTGIAIIGPGNNVDFVLRSNATERMRITSGGDVIVKGSLANFTIGSSGAELFFGRNSANYITANGGGGAEIRIISNTNGVVLANGGTSWGSLSDENSKDIIEPIVNACDNLSQVRTIIGKYKTDDKDKRRLFLIAQDIEKVYPEAVFRIKNEEEEESLALNYQDLIPVLVKAIQELKAEIDLLKGIAPIEPIVPEVTNEPETEPTIPTDNNLE